MRDVRRYLKIADLSKVHYIVARGADMHIYTIVNYIFTDGFVLSYRLYGYNNDKDVELYAYKHYINYKAFVLLKFSTSSPSFEFSNCVT